jgi:hypothetical protein
MTAIWFQPKRSQEQRARPQIDGVLGEHVQHQQIAGEEGTKHPSEAALKEFRDGVDPAMQIERNEQKQRSENDEALGGDPFKPACNHADAVSVIGQADHVLGRDVGGQQGHGDKRPPQGAPGQEVLGVGLLLARRAQNPPTTSARLRTMITESRMPNKCGALRSDSEFVVPLILFAQAEPAICHAN